MVVSKITLSLYSKSIIMNKIPEALQKAIDHVRGFFPDLELVVFNAEGQWQYFGENFTAFVFDDRISLDILEDAVNSIVTFPCVFDVKDYSK